MKKLLVALVVALGMAVCISAQTANTDPTAAKLVTSDIDLFWKAFDMAKPENDLIVFRDEYLKKGSVGLQEFRRVRNPSPCDLVAVAGAYPKYFEKLRTKTALLENYKPQMTASFKKLKEIYPAAIFPDVYFVVGKMNTAGTITNAGLLIGVDMYGKDEGFPYEKMGDWHKAVIQPIERIPNVVAHELIHYEQNFPGSDSEWPLLGKALNEGGADFIGQLISGANINPHLHAYGDPREKELWTAFKKEMNASDTSNWLYQGDKAKERPADLGYYIGYKIIESYYKNAADKRQAVKDILEIKDFGAFLKASRYEEKFN